MTSRCGPRQTMLRKVRLEHAGEAYEGTIRNISTSGAMIEGLWNVPPGTVFTVQISASSTIVATARWCKDDRMGIEFAKPLAIDGDGRIIVEPQRTASTDRLAEPVRKAG